ncbi:glycosyltransferase family 4 protein [Amylibacter sp.]|nr:glycosyltransferase family 4 protein [Amylibacter sp.]
MMKIAINASRARSGGAKAHLKALNNFLMNTNMFELAVMFVPNGTITDYQYSSSLKVFEIGKDYSNKIKELWWEYKVLPKVLRELQIDIVLNVDAGTVCPFEPSVVISQDMLSFEPGEMSRYRFSLSWIRLMVLKHIQLKSLSKADGTIFLTQYARDVIGRISKKVITNSTVINHGVNPEFFICSTKDNKNKNTIIYVSNYAPYKHHGSIIKASKFLKDLGPIKFLFIGGGSRASEVKLKKLIFQNQADNIEFNFMPFVKNMDLPNLYKQADLVLFASSCENMPITLMEGMATGLPICCSNRGPMKEVLGDCGDYFDPENPENIALSIRKILNDNKQLQSPRARARKWKWENTAFKTFNFCIRVCIQRKEK